MLDYVRVHPRLSKGRHSEGSQEERIGRGEIKICHELQQRKDRIMNTLKRHLSPRGSGPRRKVDIRILENLSISPEISPVDSISNELYPVNVPKFSMGGPGPHRKMGILLEKQSLFPELDLVHPALHELYPTGIAELSSGAVAYPLELDTNSHPYMTCVETPPPEYNPTYFGSAQGTPAKLSSGYYPICDAQRPVISQLNLAELDVGEGSSKSSEYLAQLLPSPAEFSTNDSMTYVARHFAHARYDILELDTNDSMTYAAQNFAHGSCGIAELGTNDVPIYMAQHFANDCGITELSADNGLLYAANTPPALAPQQQFDHSLLDPSSPQESLNDWCQMIHNSSPPLPVVGHYDFDHLLCEQFQNSGASEPFDLNESTPSVPQYVYPAAYHVPSTESSMSPDSLCGTSWFSSTPSLLSRTTSMSSLEFNTTPIDDPNDPGHLFFGELGHVHSEPDEMEPLPFTPKDQPNQLSNTPGNWDAGLDEDTFINDLRPVLLSPSSKMSLQEE
jgi:hypothetical protein